MPGYIVWGAKWKEEEGDCCSKLNALEVILISLAFSEHMKIMNFLQIYVKVQLESTSGLCETTTGCRAQRVEQGLTDSIGRYGDWTEETEGDAMLQYSGQSLE